MVAIEKYGIVPCGHVPNVRQLNHFYIGKKAMFSFGPNTFSNVEWGDGTDSAKIFDPTELDIRQWIRSIKAAGFQLAILVAKHHDGFCLWPSNYTDYSIKNSPYKDGKGDLVREFAEACHEYGIKVGIYVSPWDRNSKYWGTSEYSDHYARQLTEIVTQYGKIDEIWWDGAGSTETVYNWGHWAYIIREHQPDAAIFGSLGATPFTDLRWVGNERGYAGATHYASIDKASVEHEITVEMNQGKIGGEIYRPSETDVPIRPGWFYHKDQDDMVKSVSHLNNIWFTSVGRNSIMLLGLAPDQRGLLCDKDVENIILSHRCISKMLAVNYADRAKVTASPALLPELSIEKAIFDDPDLFYASAENNCVIDMSLPEETLLNVLCLGELIEAGERITAFKVEDLSSGSPELLCTGTSVGFYRAVKIKEKSYKHIRLTITDTLASPVLRSLGLYYFEDVVDDHVAVAKDHNLAKLSTSKVEYSEDGKQVNIAFGGIFPFNFVEVQFEAETACLIEAFNGTRYSKIYVGKEKQKKTSVSFDSTIHGSYQIRITSDVKIDRDYPISIKYMQES